MQTVKFQSSPFTAPPEISREIASPMPETLWHFMIPDHHRHFLRRQWGSPGSWLYWCGVGKGRQKHSTDRKGRQKSGLVPDWGPSIISSKQAKASFISKQTIIQRGVGPRAILCMNQNPAIVVCFWWGWWRRITLYPVNGHYAIFISEKNEWLRFKWIIFIYLFIYGPLKGYYCGFMLSIELKFTGCSLMSGQKLLCMDE